jgi:hypothetical protein
MPPSAAPAEGQTQNIKTNGSTAAISQTNLVIKEEIRTPSPQPIKVVRPKKKSTKKKVTIDGLSGAS